MSAHHLKLWSRRSEAISQGSKLIRSAYPSTPIYPAIGNNDCYPDYFLDLPRFDRPNLWLENLWNIWATDFSIPSDQKTHFTHGGYYSANITKDLVLLSLNTIWYSTGHDPAFNTTETPDPAGQFSWLQSQLQSARAASIKSVVSLCLCPSPSSPVFDTHPIAFQRVFIIGHILPMAGEYENAYLNTYLSIVTQVCRPLFPSLLLETLSLTFPLIGSTLCIVLCLVGFDKQFADVISGQFFGHTHRDSWARINDPVSKKGLTSLSLFLISFPRGTRQVRCTI